MNDWSVEVLAIPLTITAGAYSAGDVVGGMIHIPIDNKAGGFISQVALIDTDNEGAAMKLYIYASAPTTFADNAAFAPVAADLLKQRGAPVAISTYQTAVNSLKRADVKLDPAIGFDTGGEQLEAYLVCDATPSYAAITNLTLLLEIWRY